MGRGCITILEGKPALHASPSPRPFRFSVPSPQSPCELRPCGTMGSFHSMHRNLGLKKSSVFVALKLVSKWWQTQGCFSPQPKTIRLVDCWLRQGESALYAPTLYA